MNNKFTYYDYEDAYYLDDISRCIVIGIYLLEKLKDKHSKELIKSLKNLEYSWDMQQDSLQKVHDTLSEVKRWLMSNYLN